MNVCAVLESTGFGVKTNPLLDEPHSRQLSIEPTEVSGPEGFPFDQGRPETGHVAEEPTSVVEAFWALLERAWYTVW